MAGQSAEKLIVEDTPDFDAAVTAATNKHLLRAG